RKTDLTARRPWQELAQSNEIGKGMLVDPSAPDDEFVPEIADVSDRSTEAGQPKPGEDAEYFHRRPRAGLRLRWFCASRHNYPCLNPPLNSIEYRRCLRRESVAKCPGSHHRPKRASNPPSNRFGVGGQPAMRRLTGSTASAPRPHA